MGCAVAGKGFVVTGARSIFGCVFGRGREACGTGAGTTGAATGGAATGGGGGFDGGIAATDDTEGAPT